MPEETTEKEKPEYKFTIPEKRMKAIAKILAPYDCFCNITHFPSENALNPFPYQMANIIVIKENSSDFKKDYVGTAANMLANVIANVLAHLPAEYQKNLANMSNVANRIKIIN